MNKWIKAALIFAIGALIAWGIHVKETRELADWVSTTDAVITNIEEYENRSRKARTDRHYRIYYTYTIDGISHSGEELYSGRNKYYTIGQAAEVWYDPDEPGTSSFHKPSAAEYSLVPLLLGFFLALQTILRKDNGSQTKQKGRVRIGKRRNF